MWGYIPLASLLRFRRFSFQESRLPGAYTFGSQPPEPEGLFWNSVFSLKDLIYPPRNHIATSYPKLDSNKR
jgi:hypothetical protein